MGLRPLVALAVGTACSGGGAAGRVPPAVIPERSATAGDALLDVLPPGAEVVLEVDLARLRDNAVVGELARAHLVEPPGLPGASGASLGGADAVVLAAYRVGTPAATTMTVVRGGSPPAEAIELGEARWAMVAEGDVAAVLDASGDGDDLAADAAFLATRAWAMPSAAEGAALRLTARLPPVARTALADALGVEAAPASLSLWGDVVDDLAVIVRMSDDASRPRAGAAPPWLPAVTALRDRLAAVPEVGALGLARPIADADIRRDDGGVRVTVVIAPGRLRRAVDRWSAHRGAVP